MGRQAERACKWASAADPHDSTLQRPSEWWRRLLCCHCERRRDRTGDLQQVRSCFFLPSSPSLNTWAPSHHFLAPQPAGIPAFVGRKCLRGKRERRTVRRQRRRRRRMLASIVSARSRTTPSITSSRSCPRRTPCGHACSPGAGSISGSPPLACASGSAAMGMHRRPWTVSYTSSTICFSSASATPVSTHASSGYGPGM